MNAPLLRRLSLSLFVLLAYVTPAIGADEAQTLDERIAALEKSLTGATLVGHFTVTGAGPLRPAEERYELGEVKHVAGEMWMFQTRIRYGDHDVTVPLPIPIRWAGDTPVVCVDDLNVPGLGAYTARVFFYRDHYAGFWTGKNHGGHLYGVIEHGDAKPAAAQPADAAPPK